MTDAIIDFSTVTARFSALLDGIDDEQLSGPTPCEDYTVGGMLTHAIGFATAFTGAAKKERGPHTDTPPSPTTAVDPRWRSVLEERLAALAEAWRAPEAWVGEATAGGVTMPAEVAGMVALNEVAIHGWDLARSTGQGFDIPADVVDALLEFNGHDADDQAAREGVFGPVVPVPDDASPQERLIGITGRDPAWRP
ncbi:TIGR03086 family metal-binding protein [Glycomyces halotolerans]